MAAVAMRSAGSIYPYGPYSKETAVMKPWLSVTSYGKVETRKPFTGRLGSVARGEMLEDHGNVLNCSSMEQWHSPEADMYQGLRIARSINPCEWQFVADQLSEKFEASLHRETIDLRASDALLQRKFQGAALSVSSCLPLALAKIVSQDVQALASATRKLLPHAQELRIGLQLFGENTCSRWHQDNILCRSIVSYNCSATQYTADSNVDMDELLNCGNQDHIIRDKARIHSLGVGDILLMKGKKYPGKGRGLVHKSPEVCYSENGDVKPRLVLTVEVADLAGGNVKNSCNGD